jgi:chromosome segregation ATPase
MRNLQTKTEADFHNLAERIAKDESVPPAEALELCREAGRTPDDLEKAVARLHRIAELEKIVAQASAWREKRLKLLQDRDAEINELRKAEEELAARKARADGAYATSDWEIRDALGKISEAGSELRKLLAAAPPQAAPEYKPDLSSQFHPGQQIVPENPSNYFNSDPDGTAGG